MCLWRIRAANRASNNAHPHITSYSDSACNSTYNLNSHR